jgi:O-antigen/teichoic acid export membrane protein
VGKLLNKQISFGFIFYNLHIFIEGISGLLLYPILIDNLDINLAGLWVFFLSFSPIISLAQAGLGTVVTRVSTLYTKDKTSFNFLHHLKYSYLLVVLFIPIICSIIYFFYIRGKLFELNILEDGSLAWLMISVSFCFRMYFVKNFHVLNGFGIVGWDKITNAFITVINLIGIYFVVVNNLSFYYLGVVYFSSAIIYSLISSQVLNYTKIKKLFSLISKQINKKEIYKIFSESGKILVLNITAFIVLQLNLFVAEYFFGLKIFTYYSGLVKLNALVIALASTVSSILFPFISMAFNNKDIFKVKKLFKQNVLFSFSLAFISYLFLILVADYAIPIWLGEGGYLGNSIFIPLCMMGLLYINHVAHANSVIALGANTFIVPAILNAIFSTLFSILGAKYFGILGMVYGSILGLILPSIYVVYWSRNHIKNLKEDK